MEMNSRRGLSMRIRNLCSSHRHTAVLPDFASGPREVKEGCVLPKLWPTRWWMLSPPGRLWGSWGGWWEKGVARLSASKPKLEVSHKPGAGGSRWAACECWLAPNCCCSPTEIQQTTSHYAWWMWFWRDLPKDTHATPSSKGMGSSIPQDQHWTTAFVRHLAFSSSCRTELKWWGHVSLLPALMLLLQSRGWVYFYSEILWILDLIQDWANQLGTFHCLQWSSEQLLLFFIISWNIWCRVIVVSWGNSEKTLRTKKPSHIGKAVFGFVPSAIVIIFPFCCRHSFQMHLDWPWLNSRFIFTASIFSFLPWGGLCLQVLGEFRNLGEQVHVKFPQKNELKSQKRSLFSKCVRKTQKWIADVYYLYLLLLFFFLLQRLFTHSYICSHFAGVSGLCLPLHVGMLVATVGYFQSCGLKRSRNLLISSCLICMICRAVLESCRFVPAQTNYAD